MSARDNILAKIKTTAEFRSETVTVPEWDDETVLVREATAADRREWRARSRRFVDVAGGYELQPVEDPLSDIFLVVRCTFEADGSRRVFTDSDISALASGGGDTSAAVGRLYEAALRVSDLAVDDAGEDAEGNGPDTSPEASD